MKKCIFIASLFLVAHNGFSQSFSHGAGISIFVATASGGSAAVNGGFMYSPRFNFVEQENFSVSAGIPFSVGLSGSYSSNYNSNYWQQHQQYSQHYDRCAIGD